MAIEFAVVVPKSKSVDILWPCHTCSTCGGRRAWSRLRVAECSACKVVRRRAEKMRSCKVCGGSFYPMSSDQSCCGRSCASVASVSAARAKRSSDTLESTRMRRRRASDLRRRRGCRMRRAGFWREICCRDGWTCWLCSNPIDPTLSHPNRLAGSVDHVLPIADGGQDVESNMRAAHLSCNSRRGRARFLGAT